MSYLTCQFKDNDRSGDGVSDTARQCRGTNYGIAARHYRLPPDATREPNRHALSH